MLEKEQKNTQTQDSNTDELDEFLDESDFEEEHEGGVEEEKVNEETKSGNKASSENSATSKKDIDSMSKRERNTYFASLRKQNKELKEKNEKLEKERKQERFDLLNKHTDKTILEDLGLSKIETDEDETLVEFYKEALNNGSDTPEIDAYKKLRQINKEKIVKELENKNLEMKEKEIIKQELADVKKKFNTTVEELLKEPLFKDNFAGLIDDKKHNLVQVVESYYRTLKATEVKANEDAKKQAQFVKDSGGGNTEKKYSDLSDEEKKNFLKQKGLL